MIQPYAVIGFLAAVFPITATPGASVALLIQGGRRRAVPVIAGTVTGLYVHATLAVLGLSAIVMQSSEAFTVVRVVGAVYLIGLGLWTWFAGGAQAPKPRSEPTYVRALLANVLNPKAASICLTLVPQFVTPQENLAGQIYVLVTAHAVLALVWLSLWAFFLGKLPRTDVFRRWAKRVTAVVLVTLGVRAAAT
ncbi:LysE family translocator [Kutzneria kofuensis]|uniref:Threonine/homoserine/homoserine lactone efflux protein n=1 Tax=Kutzneria kofuensis TaxID=103725 RepID=A0A7W9KMV3_9PSEU|nr:LysE family translocator [Kutzneria kofuensis]MBB5895472.1 threonine/homoserine/homoserine lactone efflux protein [Kutzneria kofuensis]